MQFVPQLHSLQICTIIPPGLEVFVSLGITGIGGNTGITGRKLYPYYLNLQTGKVLLLGDGNPRG